MISRYKAWHAVLKELFDVSILDVSGKFPVVQLHGFGEQEFTLEDVEVIRSTSLKDINDKEIWEGDVVELHIPEETAICHLSLVTVTPEGEPMVSSHPFRLIENDNWYRPLKDFTKNYEVNKCRVISNIFQNPDADLIILAEQKYNEMIVKHNITSIN